MLEVTTMSAMQAVMCSATSAFCRENLSHIEHNVILENIQEKEVYLVCIVNDGINYLLIRWCS